jgi:hypothetical protein
VPRLGQGAGANLGGMTQPTPNARDGALRRLRGLTVGVAGTALGAVVVFAAVAAATIPGHVTAAPQASTVSTATPTSSASSTDSSLQTTTAPQTSSSSSHATTGGS